MSRHPGLAALELAITGRKPHARPAQFHRARDHADRRHHRDPRAVRAAVGLHRGALLQAAHRHPAAVQRDLPQRSGLSRALPLAASCASRRDAETGKSRASARLFIEATSHSRPVAPPPTALGWGRDHRRLLSDDRPVVPRRDFRRHSPRPCRVGRARSGGRVIWSSGGRGPVDGGWIGRGGGFAIGGVGRGGGRLEAAAAVAAAPTAVDATGRRPPRGRPRRWRTVDPIVAVVPPRPSPIVRIPVGCRW